MNERDYRLYQDTSQVEVTAKNSYLRHDGLLIYSKHGTMSSTQRLIVCCTEHLSTLSQDLGVSTMLPHVDVIQ